MASTPTKLGLLALGESPCSDIADTFVRLLGSRIVTVVRGALDGLDASCLRSMGAKTGEVPLETRLRSGKTFGLSKSRVMPRLVQAAQELSQTCDRVLLLCSGEFPELAQSCPDVIQPIVMLRGILAGAARARCLGLIGPADDLPAAPEQWYPYVPNVICAPASSTQPVGEIVEAGCVLAEQGVQMIYMDCMGFTEAHRQAVARSTGLPVLAAATLTARVLCETL